METAIAINITNIRKDEQNGHMEFCINGEFFQTDKRGDGLYRGHSVTLGYRIQSFTQFSVRGLNNANSKLYLVEWVRNYPGGISGIL